MLRTQVPLKNPLIIAARVRARTVPQATKFKNRTLGAVRVVRAPIKQGDSKGDLLLHSPLVPFSGYSISGYERE